MTKPSRNAPCPCGSGRKYKRCCYAADAQAAAEQAFGGLAGTLVEEESWFGYDGSAPADASPFNLPTEGLVCMAWVVGADDLPELHRAGHRTFTVGSWAVSTGAHEATVVHGPFPGVEGALEFGRAACGAERFFQAPRFDLGE